MNNKNNQSQLSQEQLEKMYSDQQNFFHSGIKNNITKLKEKHTLQGILTQALVTIQNDNNINTEPFVLLGGLAYLVGIDFTSSKYLDINICNNVKKRFDEINLSDDEIKLFSSCMSIIQEKHILEAKDSLKELINKRVNPDNITLNVNLLRADILNILNNSIYPVSMAMGVEEIKSNQKLTYHDYLKINSLLQKQCKIPGNLIKKLIKIYGNPLYAAIMEKSKKYFDEQKFAVIYLDSILSIVESNAKILKNYGLTSIIETILIESTLLNWEDINLVTDNLKKKETEEAENKKSDYVQDETVDINDLMDNHPDLFVSEILKDLSKKNELTIDDILLAIDKLVDDGDDYSQHIFTYLRKLFKDRKNVTFSKLYPNVKYIDLMKSLENNYNTSKDIYEGIVELTCKEIPSEILTKVVGYINLTISGLILVDDNQKQYLVSQMVENQIKTYKQLQQIVGLIESCDLKGSDAMNYVALYRFLKENTEIEKVFEESDKLDKTFIDFSIIHAFYEWFKEFENIDNKEESKEENAEVPTIPLIPEEHKTHSKHKK